MDMAKQNAKLGIFVYSCCYGFKQMFKLRKYLPFWCSLKWSIKMVKYRQNKIKLNDVQYDYTQLELKK